HLGLAGGGLPEDEAAAIVAGSRHVDPIVVREALRRHVHEYVAATPLLDKLFARRILRGDEAQLAARLDGTRTVKTTIDGGPLPQVQAARLVWGLLCGEAIAVMAEPPGQVGSVRDHLRARRARLENATHYDVLELPPDAAPIDIDRASALLSAR